MSASAPLTFSQGEDVFYDFSLVEADETTPISLVGATIQSQIRSGYNSPLTAEFSVTYTDLINGKFRLSLTNEQTSSITVNKGDKQKYLYDVEMTQQDGTKKQLMRGTIVVTREITR